MTLKQTLDKWAQELSAKAAEKTTLIQESTDAFKAVCAYFLGQQKNAKRHPDDDETGEGGFTFAGSDEVVNGERKHPQVRTRRNS
jgi:hypothetical protein